MLVVIVAVGFFACAAGFITLQWQIDALRDRLDKKP
jgi:hypothetical protein